MVSIMTTARVERSHTHDRKSFYAYVRSRSRSRTGPGPLVDEQGNTSILPLEMAEKFNSYFASVFTLENTSNMPTAESVFSGSETEKLVDFPIDELVVRKKLDKLRSDKAAGADDLSPRILYELKDAICRPLATIIKSSLDSGIVPEDWKLANVTPIFKKGSRNQAENYRPVSLTSCRTRPWRRCVGSNFYVYNYIFVNFTPEMGLSLHSNNDAMYEMCYYY